MSFDEARRRRRAAKEQGESLETIIPEALDFSNFRANNWLKPEADKNKTLREIDAKGGAVWINPAGELFFRRRENEEAARVVNLRAVTVLANFLDRPTVLLFKGSGSGDDYRPPDIAANDLLMVEERFTPFAASEFYEMGGSVYRTAFRPSPYLRLRPGDYREPETILRLLLHLCGGKEEYRRWTLNWLAGFFQTLRRSRVSLVLRGPQGSGKGLLMERIISPLFGPEYCVTVDDGRLESNFKGSWISSAVFFNLNEVSHDDRRDRSRKKNFIKMLVTDDRIQTEEKHEKAQVSELFGNVLITSNEALPIAVEPSDRRFTVFQTLEGLKRAGWDTYATVRTIEKELEDFARMLKAFPVDWELYDTALDTPEKEAIVGATNDRYALFVDALRKRNYKYFENQIENLITLTEIREALERGRISTKQLKEFFNELHDEDQSTKKLLKIFRSYDPILFSPDSRKKIGGDFYYEIP